MDADPEAFCADMNSEISHDLQSERLLRPVTMSTPEAADYTDFESADEDCQWSVPSAEVPLNLWSFCIQRDPFLCLSPLHLVCTGLLNSQLFF